MPKQIIYAGAGDTQASDVSTLTTPTWRSTGHCHEQNDIGTECNQTD